MSSVKEHIDNAQSDAASVCSDDVPNDNVRLHLKTNSLRNNVISCDSLGLHYQVSTDTSGFRAHRMIYISKWIPSTDKQIPLAEWKRQICGRGSIKLFRELAPGGSSPPEFVPMKKFIYRQHLSIFLKGSNIFNRTFTAKNGKTYTWKSRNFSLRLYCDESDKVIVKYHFAHCLINKRNGSLELISDWEDIIDEIIVSFIVVEKLRREEERTMIMIIS
ncbi:hypothetical protein PNOK_0384200 [Pyrrhoderma noxium]|uniref:DUF6593 domain-containing protein n=1 Tax=Pyrrhoderma noxium TaxID=2282107 RepID=A0A286UP22_9AGAM|nr:hypothetical protein PNOK_0384200 [Pyrrhoderma noxium]